MPPTTSWWPRTARYGSPIPATGSCPTTRAARRPSSSPPRSTGSTPTTAGPSRWSRAWSGPTASASPDGSRLYVVDSGSTPRAIHVYEVADGRVGAGRRFADMSPGSSDGIRCDTDGNLWSAAGGGWGDGYNSCPEFPPAWTLHRPAILPG